MRVIIGNSQKFNVNPNPTTFSVSSTHFLKYSIDDCTRIGSYNYVFFIKMYYIQKSYVYGKLCRDNFKLILVKHKLCFL